MFVCDKDQQNVSSPMAHAVVKNLSLLGDEIR